MKEQEFLLTDLEVCDALLWYLRRAKGLACPSKVHVSFAVTQTEVGVVTKVRVGPPRGDDGFESPIR